MSSLTGHMLQSEQRPERSRNAKAQARHRAKRKAYIEQLEQTVTKLQMALGYSNEDIDALPPPLTKIRELEQANSRLERENDELRRIVIDSGRTLPAELARRSSLSPFQPDARANDHNFKRRKMSSSGDGSYINASDSSSHISDHARPPPLLVPSNIPQPIPHHYSYVPTSSSTHNMTGSSSMFSLHAPAFTMPNTPSGSSATSSPPFSPTQMQQPIQSAPHHRSLNNPMMNNYTQQRQNQYGSVKVEDDHYASSNHHPHQHHHHSSQHDHYSISPATEAYPQQSAHNGIGSWQADYSSRSHLTR